MVSARGIVAGMNAVCSTAALELGAGPAMRGDSHPSSGAMSIGWSLILTVSAFAAWVFFIRVGIFSCPFSLGVLIPKYVCP